MDLQAAHHKSLFDNLYKYQQAGIFTDVTLTINGEEFKANRKILACHSPYFHAMFQSNMLEAAASEVKISGVHTQGFRLLLEYMYTGKLALTEENVSEVIATAVYLQVDAVIAKSIEFLASIADTDNVVDILNLATAYQFKKLQVLMIELVLKWFTMHPDVVRMLDAKQIENIVGSDLPIVGKEIDLLKTTLRWFLDGNSEELKQKETQAHRILRHIRFDEISRDSLLAIILEFFCTPGVRCEKLKEVLCELFSSAHRNSLHIIKDIRSTRGMQPAIVHIVRVGGRIVRVGGRAGGRIVRVGGFSRRTPHSFQIRCSFIDERNSRLLTTIPNTTHDNFTIAVLNNQLYIVGGCFNQHLMEVPHSLSFCYDPWSTSWRPVASMATDRRRFTLTALNNKLYAVGGSGGSLTNGAQTKTAECYDPALNKWEFIKSLPECRQQHGAVAMERDKLHLLFVSGGLCGETALASMLMYDERTDTWTSCAPMLTPRANHSMFVYKDEVYVCGGWYYHACDEIRNGKLRVDVSTIDAYNIAEKTWRHVSVFRIPPMCVYAKVTLYGSRLILIDSQVEECFDLESKQWTQWTADVMDGKGCRVHSLVILNVPKLITHSDISSII